MEEDVDTLEEGVIDCVPDIETVCCVIKADDTLILLADENCGELDNGIVVKCEFWTTLDDVSNADILDDSADDCIGSERDEDIDCTIFVEPWRMAVVAIIKEDCVGEIDWEMATVDADSIFCDDIGTLLEGVDVWLFCDDMDTVLEGVDVWLFCDDIDTVLEGMDVWLTDVVRLELVPCFLLHE